MPCSRLICAITMQSFVAEFPMFYDLLTTLILIPVQSERLRDKVANSQYSATPGTRLTGRIH